MIQASQSQRTFQCLEEGKVGVEAIAGMPAGRAAWREVRFHSGEHMILVGSDAVVVFVPDHDDGIMPLAPYRRSMYGVNDVAELQITDVDEGRVQSLLCAVVFEVEVAL